MVEGRHRRALRSETTAEGGHRCREAPRLADRDATPREGRRRLPQQLARAHRRHEMKGCRAARRDPQQLAQRLAPEDAVNRQRRVLLEVAQGRRRRAAEDAVDSSSVEPERAQPLLELGDVVAAQHRRAQVEEPVAQAVAGFDQGLPGLRAADAVDAEAPAALECLQRGTRRDPELAPRVAHRPEAQRHEPVLHIDHTPAAVALADGKGRARVGHSRGYR